jgi:hypothetical protein
MRRAGGNRACAPKARRPLHAAAQAAEPILVLNGVIAIFQPVFYLTFAGPSGVSKKSVSNTDAYQSTWPWFVGAK